MLVKSTAGVTGLAGVTSVTGVFEVTDVVGKGLLAFPGWRLPTESEVDRFYGAPSGLAGFPVVVGTSPTPLLTTVDVTSVGSIRVYVQDGGQPVHVGTSGVTMSTGTACSPGTSTVIATSAVVYGIAASGTQRVYITRNLGTAAALAVGTTTGTVAAGDDSRFKAVGTTTGTVAAGDDSRIVAAAARVLSGAGSPEGAVTAAVGTIYLRTDGGAVTTLYVKESGAGNTGWAFK